MSRLRLTQGGIENGDRDLLVKKAAKAGKVHGWTVPKDSLPGDELVIFIGSDGFFATATVQSAAIPREDWPNRYRATISDIQLIEPPISLATIKNEIPDLTWANYPRSIHTPNEEIAGEIRNLIRKRRKSGLPDIDEDALARASLLELRAVALMKAKPSASKEYKQTVYRARSQAIKQYVLARAEGICEYCLCDAPFVREDGTPYLEPHHTTRLADEGPDHPADVIALCPNCHRRAHSSADRDTFNLKLKRTLKRLEPK